MKAVFASYWLDFKFPARTSREVMLRKQTYFIRLSDEDGRVGYGECALFRGLSSDDREGYEAKLREVCRELECGEIPDLTEWPSIRFGVETALKSFANEGDGYCVFPSRWAEGEASMRINGLVWMGTAKEMAQRVGEKLNAGFKCIKLKIGGVDFSEEIEILRELRACFSENLLEIRLDANGAFSEDEAMAKLDCLSRFRIHSIEQPVKAGNYAAMERICRESPIPVALDEELIGVNLPLDKEALINYIKPAYIILKPALCGGFSGADEWIDVAEKNGVGWWATSALESNVGLNAIAQWVYCKHPVMVQGLGTGNLYRNNVESPVTVSGDNIFVDRSKRWVFPDLKWIR